jgi:hypothetical protein
MRKLAPPVFAAFMSGIATLFAATGTQDPSRTATVSGVVVSGTQPLRRAIVTVTGSALPLPRSAITRDDGRFVIAGLPAGEVTVQATKRGYLAGAAGSGAPMRLAAGERHDVRIDLARGAVIAGIVRGVTGLPIPGVRVFAIDADRPVAPPATGGDPGALTDDRGMYRVYSLPPREYLVIAVPLQSAIGEITRRSAAEVDALLARLAAGQSRPPAAPPPEPSDPPAAVASLAAVFHPGTAVMAEAVRVPLAAGDVRAGVDILMQPVPVTTIEGRVVGQDGGAPAGVEMSITVASGLRLFALGSLNPQLVEPPAADGRFRYSSISPGRYVLRARAGGAESSFAVAEVDVFGQPVSGPLLQLRRGSRFAGRVVVNASSAASLPDLSRVRVSLVPVDRGGGTVARTIVGSTLATERSAGVRADGTFEITGLAPARYQLQVAVTGSAGERWSGRVVTIDERAIGDAPVEIVSGVDVTNAIVQIDRVSQSDAIGIPRMSEEWLNHRFVIQPFRHSAIASGAAVGPYRITRS